MWIFSLHTCTHTPWGSARTKANGSEDLLKDDGKEWAHLWGLFWCAHKWVWRPSIIQFEVFAWLTLMSSCNKWQKKWSAVSLIYLFISYNTSLFYSVCCLSYLSPNPPLSSSVILVWDIFHSEPFVSPEPPGFLFVSYCVEFFIFSLSFGLLSFSWLWECYGNSCWKEDFQLQGWKNNEYHHFFPSFFSLRWVCFSSLWSCV